MNGVVRTPKYVIALARVLRKRMTPVELILWDRLKSRQLLGFKFRRQHPIYRYILDFYCPQKKLAIEVDGKIHEERFEYDFNRDNYLKNIGIRTLRFSNTEIIENIERVLLVIKDNLNIQ